MTSAPLWLLDFDGVINACGPKPDYAVHPEWKQTVVHADSSDWPEAWPVCYAPAVIGAINEAVAAGADVRWLSTWQHRTVVLPKFLDGLPDLPTLTTGDADVDYDSVAWWKLPIAQTIAGDDRRLVWTDDDLKYDPASLRWLDTRAKKAATLPISPNVKTGLTVSHLRDVADFLAR